MIRHKNPNANGYHYDVWSKDSELKNTFYYDR